MKHLKLFENFENIDEICNKYGIENYTINPDGTVDVSEDVYNVYNLFTTHKDYIASLDYNYIRGNNIVKSRFEEALDEIDKALPEKIEGYNYI